MRSRTSILLILAFAMVLSARFGIATSTVKAATTTATSGVYVSSNRLIDGTGSTVVLRGVNKSGSEYACIDGWGFFDGPTDQASVTAMKTWNINAVRVPLNSACWLDVKSQFATYNAAYSGANYRAAIKTYVDLLNSNGIYAILDLQWTGCGTSSCLANWLKPMPDRPYATQFWTSVATTFKDNKSVLFDLFNEPQSVDWTCWKSGGCTAFAGQSANQFTTEGMQQMVNAVRAAGATTQPIMLGGLQYSNDMRGWLANLPTDPNNSLTASIHLYNFNYPCPEMVDSTQSAATAIKCFTDTAYNPLGAIAAKYPIIFGELGQDNCRSDFVSPVLDWIAANGYSVLGWAWNTHDCATFPALITNYDGTPTALGVAFRDFFRGHPVSTPSSTAPPQPEGEAMQMISSGRPAFASAGEASQANDSTYDSTWAPGDSGWLAYDLSAVPEAMRTKVVATWYAGPDDGYSVSDMAGVCPAWSGRPYLRSYKIEVNAAGGGTAAPTRGWVVRATDANNTKLSGQHLFDMSGYNWIRISGSGPNGIALNFDVADASSGVTDGWLFTGDSITAAYAGHVSLASRPGGSVGSLTDLVASATGGARRPLVVNNGTACAKAADALIWLDSMLAAFQGKYVTLNFGTNDGWDGAGNPDAYYADMLALVDKVIAAGKTPVVATIPWPNNTGAWQSGIVAMNTKIAALYQARSQVLRGPDLYNLTRGRSELFGQAGDVHPNEAGSAAIRAAWAQTAHAIYDGAQS